MRYISVCSGIEAASVAWGSLSWEPVAFAEIDAFPSAVLAHHYPTVPNLGDISKVDWRPYHGTVDLVVGGTPCQSFSIAGKREGLDGASGLVFEYFRLLREVQPRWFVWENVPGSFSSNGGFDFQSILREWDKCGYHVAWRVLDAQFFGVPQRRRRIFAVGHLGDWRHPAQVLFERESLCGDTAQRQKTPVFPCLTRTGGHALDDRTPYVLEETGIRRATPTEWERLQGFPDGYTDIPWRGKDHAPDGLRYKALGNSMCVNVMRWIGERIQSVEDA